MTNYSSNNCCCRSSCSTEPACDNNVKAYGEKYNTEIQVITLNTSDTYELLSLNSNGPSLNVDMLANEIVITKAGVYELYYNINVFGTSRTYNATILRNNAEISTTTTSVTATESASGSFIANLSASTFVSLSVGDTISLALSTNNPGTVTVGTYANCALSVKKL